MRLDIPKWHRSRHIRSQYSQKAAAVSGTQRSVDRDRVRYEQRRMQACAQDEEFQGPT